MFEKVLLAAEKMATTASRRAFLGRLARLAGGAVLTVAGVLAAGPARAAGGDKRCCKYFCSDLFGGYATFVCRGAGRACASTINHKGQRCFLYSDTRVANCSQCA